MKNIKKRLLLVGVVIIAIVVLSGINLANSKGAESPVQTIATMTIPYGVTPTPAI